jgi:trimeric autotransporter adhesin
MSTKTTFKRIALVAVASLGFGLLSAAPSNAANAAGLVNSISLARVTAAPTANAAVAVNFLADTDNLENIADDLNTFLFSAYLSSYPAGGFKQVSWSSSAPTTDTELYVASAAASTDKAVNETTPAAGYLVSVVHGQTDANNDYTGNTALASATVGAAQASFTPTVAGTYVMTVWNDADADGVVDVIETVQTISITVAAATQLSTTQSILRMAGAATLAVTQNSASATLTDYTTTVNAVPRSAAKGTSAATNNIGKVAVVLINADGTPAGNGHTVTADISGSGLVLCNNSGTEAAGTVRSSALTLTGTDNVAVCHLSSDGTAGAGTVTISVTDSVSGTKTVLGTRTFTSYGDVAKLEVSTTNYTIGRAGFATGVASTTREATKEIGNTANVTASITVTSGTSTTPAFIVKATDSSGSTVVTTADPVIRSSNVDVISGGTCARDGGPAAAADALVKSSPNGIGFYNCAFTTTPTAVSGAKATLTIRVVDPAGDGTTFLTTTLDVTVGGSVATETITFDKATYAPGEAMVVTRTAVDSAGNPVFDGAAAPAITFNKALGGSAIGASIYVGGKRATSATTPSVFAPVVVGAFTGRATSGNAAATALTATATVADEEATAGVAAAADAAAEATDAANAATDAANAAAEAADAATAAAQDAADAVAALSASVATMVSDLKKQITSLTNLVIKIQKKVRA